MIRQFLNSQGECNSYYACILGDWTFDKFYNACQQYKALPMIKGVYSNHNASDVERFVAILKRDFAMYKAELEREYDCSRESLEDIFNMFANNWNFSDYYKDTFNQRPHLNASFYLYAMGYHNVGGIRFCMPPFSEDVEDAIWSAEAYRNYLVERA